MKYLILIIYFSGIILFGIGIISVNLTWVTFLLLLAAIIFGVSYPMFDLTHLSLFGTPLELFIGGIISMILGKILMNTAYKIDLKIKGL